MAAFNNVVLMGNLTRDPDTRTTPGGTKVADLNLAVNEKRKDQNGEWIDDTLFIGVTVFGRLAEIAGTYLVKGSPVHVSGKLKLDTWEQDGVKHYRHKVIGSSIQLLDFRDREKSAGSEAGTSAKSSEGSRRPQGPPPEMPEDNDPPF